MASRRRTVKTNDTPSVASFFTKETSARPSVPALPVPNSPITSAAGTKHARDEEADEALGELPPPPPKRLADDAAVPPLTGPPALDVPPDLQDEYDALGPRWFAALRAHLTQPSYRALAARVRSARAGSTPIYPPHTDVFSWARFTPDPAQVRCVILGQDPYHGPGQAHGLAFSVRPGVPTPPSLRNMFRELAESDLSAWKARCAAAQRASSSPSSPVVKPPTGDLSAWAAQGVLLLNASLTVPRGQANGHKTWGWHAFTDAVIDIVARSSPHCVFLLWGRDAQLKVARLPRVAAGAAVVGRGAVIAAKPPTKPTAPAGAGPTDALAAAAHCSHTTTGPLDAAERVRLATLMHRPEAAQSASPDWPRHLVLQSAHPSPLAAHNGFFKNGHYVAANLFLRAHGLPPIDWLSVLAPADTAASINPSG